MITGIAIINESITPIITFGLLKIQTIEYIYTMGIINFKCLGFIEGNTTANTTITTNIKSLTALFVVPKNLFLI